MSVVIESAPKLLLTQRQAAEVLGLSERKLWALSDPRGDIPTVRIGKCVRYSVDALHGWVEEQSGKGN